MRFSIQLPTDRVEQPEEFVSQQAVRELARGIEAAGFDACYVTEHPFPPQDFLETGGHHALDPFVALSFAAADTRSLLLHTNILVLAYRNPFLSAKAIASLDVLSGGRAIIGVAAGYLEGEYRALGADFAHRNDVTDDALLAIRAAWSGQGVTRKTGDYEATGNRMLPLPAQRPHPPIWVGGNSKVAIRRAARLADGWSPFPLPARYRARTRTAAIESVEDLALRIRELHGEAEKQGRKTPLDVNFVPFGRGMNSQLPWEADAFLEEMHVLENAGVTWLSLGLPGTNRAELLENIERFGAEVIRPSRP